MSDVERDGPGAGILPHSTRRPRRTPFLAAAGPLVIGIAAWCAAGTLSVAAAENPGIRVALPAPWWVALVGAAIAAGIPALRRAPVLATPALLSTWPWWPIPTPAIALLWTGPMAWLPVGLSLMAAIAVSVRQRTQTAERATSGRRQPRLAAVAAGAMALTVGVAAAVSVAPHVPGGDEPHYLVITQSLLLDGDLRIQNNHDRGDYREYYGGPLEPHTLARSRDGAVFSVHAPGTAVLVLPGFAVAGYVGAQAVILLCAALAATLIWRAAWLLTNSTSAAWMACAATVLSVTFALLSGMVFPDGPGALATAAGVWLLARLWRNAPIRSWMLIAVASALAALPWLHTRFAVLAAGLGAAIVWAIVRQSPSPSARRRRLVIFAAVPVVGAAGWFAFFWIVYGTPNPIAPYGGAAETSWRYVPGGFAASLFDAQYGLLAYAPVLAATVFGWRDRVVRQCLLIAAAYLAAVATYWMWWGGLPATPARFVTAALPLLAPGIAVAWDRATSTGRAALFGWLVVSVAIAAVTIGTNRGALAWNYRDGQPQWLEWLGPVVNLPRGLPSFFWDLRVENGQPVLASEWPFIAHAAVVVSILIACSLAAVVVGRRRAVSAAGQSTLVAWGICLGIALAIQTGWWLRGTTGLDPATSQVELLNATVAGVSPLRIGPGTLGRTAAGDLRITPPEGGVYRSAGWGIVPGLPAGRYELRFFMTRPAPTDVRVRIGRGPVLTTCALAPLSQQACTVDLPASGVLVLESDREVKDTGGKVEIRRE